MNMNFFISLIIRTATFSGCMYAFFYLPFLQHLFDCRDALNSKYYPRYKEFIKTKNFLLMNPDLLNDPELTEEEHGHYIQAIENLKMMDLASSKKNI